MREKEKKSLLPWRKEEKDFKISTEYRYNIKMPK